MSMKAKGMSISKRLSNLAAKEQIPFKHLGTAFLIERLVWRLTTEPSLASKLVFKGGFVGLRVYDSRRYTIDLDALLRKADIEATLKITQAAAEKEPFGKSQKHRYFAVLAWVGKCRRFREERAGLRCDFLQACLAARAFRQERRIATSRP